MTNLHKLLDEGEVLSKQSYELLADSEIVYSPYSRTYGFISSSGDYRWSFKSPDVVSNMQFELQIWTDNILEDNVLNSNRVCKNEITSLKTVFVPDWRVCTCNKVKELEQWKTTFTKVLSIIRIAAKYETPTPDTSNTGELTLNINANTVNIIFNQVDNLVLEIETLANEGKITLSDDLRKALGEYHSDSSDRSKARSIISKLKSGVTASGPYVNLINAFLEIISGLSRC